MRPGSLRSTSLFCCSLPLPGPSSSLLSSAPEPCLPRALAPVLVVRLTPASISPSPTQLMPAWLAPLVAWLTLQQTLVPTPPRVNTCLCLSTGLQADSCQWSSAPVIQRPLVFIHFAASPFRGFQPRVRGQPPEGWHPPLQPLKDVRLQGWTPNRRLGPCVSHLAFQLLLCVKGRKLAGMHRHINTAYDISIFNWKIIQIKFTWNHEVAKSLSTGQ